MVLIAALFFVLNLFPSVDIVAAEKLKMQPRQTFQVSKITATLNQYKLSGTDKKAFLEENLTLDNIEKSCKIVAYFIGAIWVYFNYFKGRTYRPRVETKLAGNLVLKNTLNFVKLDLQIKNVGLAKVDISQKGTALRLLVYKSTDAESLWEQYLTVAILEEHQWIEPGEIIEEQVLLPLECDTIAVRAEVIVVSTKTMWETAAILV